MPIKECEPDIARTRIIKIRIIWRHISVEISRPCARENLVEEGGQAGSNLRGLIWIARIMWIRNGITARRLITGTGRSKLYDNSDFIFHFCLILGDGKRTKIGFWGLFCSIISEKMLVKRGIDNNFAMKYARNWIIVLICAVFLQNWIR